MEIPNNYDIVSSSAIPEVWLTSFLLLKLAQIKKNDFCLVHAASSGVGTALLQLIKLQQAFSIGLCSTQDKIEFCEKYLFFNQVWDTPM